jgi:anti-sigma regulatory factor (Ser/Thr protein kinase)
VSFSTYTATSWRDGASWAVRVAQLDRTTRAARLSEVDAAARRLIATVTEEDPEEVRVVVDLRVPEGLSSLLAAAAAARQDADLVSVEAVAYRRTLARRLSDHGYGIREIAVLLGVSYPRAKQLAGDPAESHPSRQRAGAGSPAPAAKPHSSYQHEAFLYRNLEEFLAGTVPFIEDAVALEQPVLVALIKPRLELVRNALGALAEQVFFVDMADLGRNPARIIPQWLGFVEEYGGPGKPVRGLGEPQWVGRRPEEAVECQLHEGLLNVAIDPDIPLWLRCPYDVSALSPSLVEAALRSHPALVEVGSYRGSTRYGGLHHVESVFRSPLPEPPADSTRIAFGAADLGALRAHVTRAAIDAGLGADRSRAMTSAVAEIAANSVRHGGGAGELRTWLQADALICEVTDPGRFDNPLVGRLTPAPEEQRGRGLWLANQFSDLVQIRSTPCGTAVRIFAWLSRSTPLA